MVVPDEDLWARGLMTSDGGSIYCCDVSGNSKRTDALLGEEFNTQQKRTTNKGTINRAANKNKKHNLGGGGGLENKQEVVPPFRCTNHLFF